MWIGTADPAIFFCAMSDGCASTQASLPMPKKDVCVGTSNSTASIGSNPIFLDILESHRCFQGYESIFKVPENDRDEAVKGLLGIRMAAFEMLLGGVLPQFKSSRLKVANMLMLFLMKLRHNFTFSTLGLFFGMQRFTASRQFYQMLVATHSFLDGWIFWPSQGAVKKKLTCCFRDLYPDCRAIVNCVEVPVCMPSKLGESAHKYSRYKGHHTVKLLIASAPCGAVTFISKVYAGGETNLFVATDSGFLELAEQDDVFLTDKELPSISSALKKRGARLVKILVPRPNDEELATGKAKETSKAVLVRGQVERCIQRPMLFRIVSEKVSSELLPHFYDITYVCAVLANLQLQMMNPEASDLSDV